MDLRAYYRKVREIEETLPAPFVVLVSLETSDGGKAGVKTQTPRLMAARHIAEGSARLATPEEAADYEKVNREAKQAHEDSMALNRMQVVVVPAGHGNKGPKGL